MHAVQDVASLRLDIDRVFHSVMYQQIFVIYTFGVIPQFGISLIRMTSTFYNERKERS